LAKVRLSGICNATLNIVEFVIQQKTPSFFSSAPAYSHQFCLLKINPVNLNVKTFKEKPKFDTVRAIANCLMLRAGIANAAQQRANHKNYLIKWQNALCTGILSREIQSANKFKIVFFVDNTEGRI